MSTNKLILITLSAASAIAIGYAIVTNYLVKGAGPDQPVLTSGVESRAKTQDTLQRFRLFTRVTETTWPKLQEISREQDVFWGRDASVPITQRAFTFSNLGVLTSRFTPEEAKKYSAINLDGEYSDFRKAYDEAVAIRSFVDAENTKRIKEGNLEPLAFVAFYHLNIINAYPDIVRYPDIVLIGKTNWDESTVKPEAQRYVNLIKNANRTPGILLGAYTKDAQGKELKSAQSLVKTMQVVMDPTNGLGVNVIGYYYDKDDAAILIEALTTLRHWTL
jgi:hypothetical protein